MDSIPARGPAPWWEQAAAIVVVLAIAFVVQIINVLTFRSVGMGLIPASLILMISICLVTIRVRSLWPAVALAGLVLGFAMYATALNWNSGSTGVRIFYRNYMVGSMWATAELGIGALAGWLWYRRESRLAGPPASA